MNAAGGRGISLESPQASRRIKTARELSFPASQPQRVADDDQIGHTHRQRANHRAEETQRRERHSGGVIEKRPEKVLLDGAQRRLRQAECFRNRLDVRFEQDNVGGFAGNVAGLSHRDAEIGLLECRGIVDAVADECRAVATA